MLSLVFIAVVTTLAVFTILAKTRAGKTQKAEKWEKGEIIKQLVALSERENSSSVVAAPPARSPCSASTSATCGDTSRKGTSRGRNSNRRYPTANSQPPILPRPNQADAQIEEKIRQRAYELYRERGRANGSPTDDWLQAKQEVLSRKARAGSGSS
jgi:DUF2934 family protein